MALEIKACHWRDVRSTLLVTWVLHGIAWFMDCVHCTVFKIYIYIPSWYLAPSGPCTLRGTYHRQDPVRFMVRTTVRTLYALWYYHCHNLYASWYVPPSGPCELRGTYHRQDPVHFVVRTTVRTLYTSWYVPPSGPVCFVVRTTVRTVYSSWYVPPSGPCPLRGTYHHQDPVHFVIRTTVRTCALQMLCSVLAVC